MTSAFIILCLVALVAISALTLWLLRRMFDRLLRSQQDIRATLRAIDHSERERQGRSYLASLLQWDEAVLPPLGSWAASADFLIILAETILHRKPTAVVEFGSGVTTLVTLRCLELNGHGRLTSYDHDEGFAGVTRDRAARLNLPVSIQAVNLRAHEGYNGVWYEMPGLPETIDLMVIDGPPALIHPETRGGAATAFARLTPGATILLDDAARAGEREIVRQWQIAYPDIQFAFIGTCKGTAMGRRGS